MRSRRSADEAARLTTTFRRGSDFRAYVQDPLAARGKPGEREPSAPDLLRARIGGTTGAALRERFSAAAAGFRSLVAAANAVLRRQVASPAPDEDELPPAEALRSRRAHARPSRTGAPSRKLNLEQSRREIEAVQARLDARPGETAAPRDERERWAAELAREYRREFHPLEAASEPAPAAVEDNPTAAEGAAAAFFVAGKAAWRVGLFLEPAARFISAHSAPILKVAAVALAMLAPPAFSRNGRAAAEETRLPSTPRRRRRRLGRVPPGSKSRNPSACSISPLRNWRMKSGFTRRGGTIRAVAARMC